MRDTSLYKERVAFSEMWQDGAVGSLLGSYPKGRRFESYSCTHYRRRETTVPLGMRTSYWEIKPFIKCVIMDLLVKLPLAEPRACSYSNPICGKKEWETLYQKTQSKPTLIRVVSTACYSLSWGCDGRST